jgi:hypothetical protein
MSLVSAAALMGMDFPVARYAVDNLIAEGLALLVGSPKLGKSWLMLNIALAIALGGMALGKIRVQQGGVLYLALEDSERRMQERLEMVLKGEHAPDSLRFAFDWLALADGGGEDLRSTIDSWPECRLVIIDVLARLRSPITNRTDPYMADYLLIEKLKRIADDTHTPMVVVHHTRKASAADYIDQVSGTAGLAGAADTVLVLKRSRSEAGAELSVTGRDIEEQALALSFSPEIGTWTMVGPAAEWNVSAQRRAIIRALRKTGGGIGPKQIAELSGVEYEVARKLVVTMANADQIIQRGRGTYSLHSQRSQTLAVDGNEGNDVNGPHTPMEPGPR